MKKVIVAVVVLMLLVTACGASGTVVGKRHIPEGKESFTDCHFMPGTSVMTCVPSTRYVPEQWILVISECGDSGNCKDSDAYVDKGTYDSYKVGDSY